MNDLSPHQTGGGALLVGYLLVVLVLYRSPERAIEAASATPQSVVYFVVLPVLGLAGGVYSYFGGPYSGAPLFGLGSYLGLVGLGLTFGSLLAPDPVGLPLVVGVVVLALAVVALVASLRRLFGGVSVGSTRLLPD